MRRRRLAGVMLGVASLAHAYTPPHTRLVAFAPPQRRCSRTSMELGLQVDVPATVSSLFVLGSFALLQLKIRGAEAQRGTRDASVETFRKAEVLLLAGKITSEEAERAKAAAVTEAERYDSARQVLSIPGALLRVPDPSAAQVQRVLKGDTPSTDQRPPSDGPASTSDGQKPAATTEQVRPVEAPDDGSLLPTGSRTPTLKDVAIGSVLVLQIGWFLLSLTDPIGAPNPLLEAVLTSGGEMVDRMEEEKAAASEEYAAMLRAAREEAVPACAIEPLTSDSGGCATADPEFVRTRGLDSNRGWISGASSKGGVDAEF